MFNYIKNFKMPCLLLLIKLLLLLLSLCPISCNPITSDSSSGSIDPRTTLGCHRREYTYKVVRSDSLGRKCWGYVRAMSCWGRCDSNEIADWQFPFKISYHPVCIHDQRVLQKVTLANCEADVELGTSTYEYYDAVTCSCRKCKSSSANCEGLRHVNRHGESNDVK
ncbi:glycoprotein hormone beta [Chamberlinius hualienensis]